MSTRLIDDFFERPNSATMDALISWFRRDDASDEDIAYLAAGLGTRGKVLTHSPGFIVADVPSTGGPSSLSTLLAPLELVLGGAIVPKLGVPGRPAGGIDVLACIPGFKVMLDVAEVRRCLDTCGYAHFLAGELFAPLDAMLFSYRQEVGAQDVPNLAAASLLSKKIAVGVNSIALDVRIAPFNNFGEWEVARKNARRFVRIATQLGIHATAFLSDGSVPYQGFIGRGEALTALNEILTGTADRDLMRHADFCRQMAQCCVDSELNASPSTLAAKFESHLEQQGATWADFQRKIQSVRLQPRAAIKAESDGFSCVDLNEIRRVLSIQQQRSRTVGDVFPDPCGVTLVVPCGDLVKNGDTVAEVRAARGLESIVDELRASFFQLREPMKRRNTEQIQ